ncbi:hypothetical protein TNIN_290891 [Trichonephila inaurata madagascariensis]|uniref:Uncharacterized protein n=1 Tax=Trichonephila inaurata madagascariensis TaxID=2747483 RepID=A0A8X6XDT5_9ARAC|nr:hypothetical protein TNIN_290891 [Trichonephila inaurata madagascariensis]
MKKQLKIESNSCQSMRKQWHPFKLCIHKRNALLFQKGATGSGSCARIHPHPPGTLLRGYAAGVRALQEPGVQAKQAFRSAGLVLFSDAGALICTGSTSFLHRLRNFQGIGCALRRPAPLLLQRRCCLGVVCLYFRPWRSSKCLSILCSTRPLQPTLFYGVPAPPPGYLDQTGEPQGETRHHPLRLYVRVFGELGDFFLCGHSFLPVTRGPPLQPRQDD